MKLIFLSFLIRPKKYWPKINKIFWGCIMGSLKRLFIVLFVVTIAGCGAGHAVQHKSSVLEYLFPDPGATLPKGEVIPPTLPIKIGIVFVPGSGHQGTSSQSSDMKISTWQHSGLTEKEKLSLMEEVSKPFKKYDFIESVELISSTYVEPKGSFANLDQLQSMFGIDSIVLLSYNQSQFTDEGFSSISYWTLVGIYMVKGEKNDTHTSIDAAVYHIPSRKMMFSTLGTSDIKTSATPINLSEQTRIDSLEGFKEATKDLVKNLDEQLSIFQSKLKD